MASMALMKLLKKARIPVEAISGHAPKFRRTEEAMGRTSAQYGKSAQRGATNIFGFDPIMERERVLRDRMKRIAEIEEKLTRGVEAANTAKAAGAGAAAGTATAIPAWLAIEELFGEEGPRDKRR